MFQTKLRRSALLATLLLALPAAVFGQDSTRGTAAADAVGANDKQGGGSAPGLDYTKISNAGAELPESAALGAGENDWGCTRDNRTGLIWEIKTDDDGLRDKDHRYNWYDTDTAINGGTAGTVGTATYCARTLARCNTTAYRNAVNALAGAERLCGATDWRLPSAKELETLIHRGAAAAPYVDGTWFPRTYSGVYWSGENHDSSASLARSADFSIGYLGGGTKGYHGAVRLVRAGQ